MQKSNLPTKRGIKRYRRAGGVAIFRNINSSTECEPVVIDWSNYRRLIDNGIGDICMVKVLYNGVVRFILGSVYIHPYVSISDMEMLLFSAMIKYSPTTRLISDNMEVDTNVPIIIVGDFNVDAKLDLHALSFMKKHFNLDYVPIESPTTLGALL